MEEINMLLNNNNGEFVKMKKITMFFVCILIIATAIAGTSCKMIEAQGNTAAPGSSETSQGASAAATVNGSEAAGTASPTPTGAFSPKPSQTQMPSASQAKPALQDTFTDLPALSLSPGETVEADSSAVKAQLEKALPLMQYAANLAASYATDDIAFPAGDLAAWPIVYEVAVKELFGVAAQGIETQDGKVIIEEKIIKDVIAKSCFATGEMPDYYNTAEYAGRIQYKDKKYIFDSKACPQLKIEFSPTELYVDADGKLSVTGMLLSDGKKTSQKLATITLQPVQKSLFGYALISIHSYSLS